MIEINFCKECGMLIEWVNQLKIEKENENSYYIRIFGYYEIKKGCNKCEKELNKIIMNKRDGGSYDIILYTNSVDFKYLKDIPFKENRWYYFLLSRERIEEKKIDLRIRGEVQEYTLLRYKENEKYETYQIFGYNGEKLYIKQTIGVKKE